MPAVINREMGSIIIENNVLASIAGMSAMESYGIVGMASKNATDGLLELLRFENISKGIKVITDDDKLVIELHVVLEYGVRISTVGQNIIDNVKFRIKELTNLEPDQVSVIVEGIRIK
ncbi:putative alkaline shock family protein YloU [Peptoniphilus koenoeneniae]|uniref:Alkaline shock family protein YloU n=1 Tax=Peptoniphilus koenoeneniae TaxID=507751 RepID=A0ABU0AZF1_9FIRM|nr:MULTISPECIES: Asp23/Gls24 family envelope stress response protein [Peptoniphilus]ERT56234.1 alkaline shock protein Asp23 family protein [Peptoniphilus sp. BV3C26]MDQ0275330.1 putative alkaline shock family protein YloU [Peptoniphilus koenoeneniae]